MRSVARIGPGQRRAVDEIHHQVRTPVDRADLVNGGEVGVVDAGQQRRFPPECRQLPLRAGRGIKNFERVHTIRFRLAHPVDSAVGAATQLGFHHETGDPATGFDVA
jgi:hypothetical protein